jgi:hypothetical protein
VAPKQVSLDKAPPTSYSSTSLAVQAFSVPPLQH